MHPWPDRLPRRSFLRQAAVLLAGLPLPRLSLAQHEPRPSGAAASARVTLFLGGDVMTGRAIDQILPHPSRPDLYESYLRSALDYLRLAEQANGPIPRPADWSYVWGEALAELRQRRPDARIINLETAVTRNDQPWPKAVNYRMHPGNVGCLKAAAIDCCVLSNNHVIDWGRQGLLDTLDTLKQVGIQTAGAGIDLEAAQAPAALGTHQGRRILLFAGATLDCGVPPEWAAASGRSGVHLLSDLSPATQARIGDVVRRFKHAGDLAVFSLHWGGNWGYSIDREQREFAHGLIDRCGIDLVHGHSSHHVKALEVYRNHLILYGCGDLLDDYEGIEGYEEFRGELGLMYFPTLAATGNLHALEMVPTRIRRFRLERAAGDDRRWLLETLQRECGRFGGEVAETANGSFALRWA